MPTTPTLLEKLDKAMKVSSGANFLSSAVLLVLFLILKNHPDFEAIWFLLGSSLFAIAGIGMILLIRSFKKRLQQKEDEAVSSE